MPPGAAGGSAGLARQERVAVDLKPPGIALPPSIAERIERLADLDIDEANFLQHRHPALARKATCYSSRPEVDVADGRLRNRFPVGDIAELHCSSSAQNPPKLFEDPFLIGA